MKGKFDKLFVKFPTHNIVQFLFLEPLTSRIKLIFAIIVVAISLNHAYTVEKTVHYAPDAMVYLGILFYLSVVILRKIRPIIVRIVLLTLILLVFHYKQPIVWSTALILSVVVLI